METLSALLALGSGNSPVTGEFPSQRPVTRSFDVFFDLRPNKRLKKKTIACGWSVETPVCSLWHHCNATCKKWPPFCRRHFQTHFDDNNNYCIWIQIWLNLVPGRIIDNKSSLVQIMAWRRTCNKLLAIVWISNFVFFKWLTSVIDADHNTNSILLLKKSLLKGVWSWTLPMWLSIVDKS